MNERAAGLCIGRTDHDRVGNHAQAGQRFHRLVRWTVLARRNDVVDEDIDHVQFHQRRPGIVAVREQRLGACQPCGPMKLSICTMNCPCTAFMPKK